MTSSQLGQIIPVFIIAGFILFPDQTILLSESILGRIIAVSIIIFYTMLDFEYGFFACVLVLLFYHFSLADKMLIVNHPLRLSGFENMRESFATDEPYSVKPYDGSKSNSKPFPAFTEISLENMEDSTDEQILLQKRRSQLADMFRQENCKEGRLLYKGNPVNSEMAPHVFGELKYTGDKCNPCDKGCQFSIIEERFKTEQSLAPVSARESTDMMEKISGQFEPVMAYFKNTFNQFFVYK